MKTIWKFPFDITPHQQIEVPRGARTLHVGLDPKDKPCLWCAVDDAQEKRTMDLYVVGTGQQLTLDAPKHLGTFVWKHTGTVWHVFTS